MSTFPWQKKVIIAIWLTFLAVCLSMLLMYPQHFKAQAIADFVSQFKNTLLIVYLTISILRGFTLIPSSPFVLAGTILFPANPFSVLAISILGIVFSSSMIYYFSDFLGFGPYLENKYPTRISKIKHHLQRPTGFIFVVLWAFFPFVPTDAVCYVAGVLKTHFVKFILAIFLGEIILCSIYVFGYSYVVQTLG